MDYHIRKSSFDECDTEILFDLYKKIFPEKHFSFESLKLIPESEPAEVWYVLKEKEIGFLYFWKNTPTLFEIIDVGVVKEFRKQGVADFLLKQFLNSIGNANVNLEVRESNVIARQLYEKRGFVLSGKRENYYSDSENACLYSLKLVSSRTQKS